MYSHLFKNFPQFVVIHTVKGFNVVSEAEVGVFLKFFCFFCDPNEVGNLLSVSSAFSKSSLKKNKKKKGKKKNKKIFLKKAKKKKNPA